MMDFDTPSLDDVLPGVFRLLALYKEQGRTTDENLVMALEAIRADILGVPRAEGNYFPSLSQIYPVKLQS